MPKPAWGRQGANVCSQPPPVVPKRSYSKGDHCPVHTVRLHAFYLDEYEVINARYRQFCEATGHRLPFFWRMIGFRCGPGYPDHPVIGAGA
jgi:formylglycine-generating enzyme required for sulfatase activity